MTPAILAQVDAASLTIPIAVVASMVSAAAGVGAAWAALKGRLNELSHELDEHRGEIKELRGHRETHDRRLVNLEADVKYTRDTVGRIERMLERALDRGE
jgi:chromosome segregation ATPase